MSDQAVNTFEYDFEVQAIPEMIATIQKFRATGINNWYNPIESDPRHDNSRRMLSEMPLCDIIPELQEFFPGCQVVSGYVTISSKNMRIDHNFFLAPNGQIICVFPGQFVDLLLPQIKIVEKGARMRLLQETYPDLFLPVNEEICLLVGYPWDIQNQIGLVYTGEVIDTV